MIKQENGLKELRDEKREEPCTAHHWTARQVRRDEDRNAQELFDQHIDVNDKLVHFIKTTKQWLILQNALA